MRLSIVVPVLNEAAGISGYLAALAPPRARGAEIVVVDGGSADGTPALARDFADLVLPAPRGRARQMNAGAKAAQGDVLLFLHADTLLPEGADRLVLEALSRPNGPAWGRFDVEIAGRHPLLKLVARTMNIRSRLSGIATGDQAMFMRRAAFETLGGFPDVPIMEDIALSARLKRLSRPACLRERVATSGRRWEKGGVVRTVLLMWRLRLAWFFGADPRRLARAYGYAPD